MTANILRTTGAEAYDLIYQEHLSMLPDNDQEIMHRHMMNSSRVWIGSEDAKILCFLGIIPPTLLSDRAYLWLYTTEHLHEHVFIFVRHSQKVIAEVLEEFPLIVGHCAVGNRRAHRWLEWLGAKFLPAQDLLLPFEIRKPAS